MRCGICVPIKYIGVKCLKKKWQKFLSNGYVDFILKTIFYFAVLFALVYLYSYSGVNQPHFIYNEF